jgi:hypothetical protein
MLFLYSRYSPLSDKWFINIFPCIYVILQFYSQFYELSWHFIDDVKDKFLIFKYLQAKAIHKYNTRMNLIIIIPDGEQVSVDSDSLCQSFLVCTNGLVHQINQKNR